MSRFIGLVFLMMLAGCNLGAEPAPTLAPTPNIPRLQFIAPNEGDRVIPGYDLTIDVVAEDMQPGAGVAKIELYLNDQLYREVTPENDIPVPVFRAEMNWFTEGIGRHVFSAVAYRRDGTRSDEALINIEVVQN